jgi:hypothetical protein
MRRVNRSWMAVVAAALLLGTLAGVVWARPNDRPQAQDITRKVTLSAADFIPNSDDWNYGNSGALAECSGMCNFNAPIVFPCLPAVTVERIKLHVRDDNGTQTASASLYRAKPSVGAGDFLGAVASPTGTSDGLQTYTSGTINKVVWPSQKAYIWVSIGGGNIGVYGVTVEYHRNI